MFRKSKNLILAAVFAALSPVAAAQGYSDSGPFARIDPEERITVNFKDEDLSAVLELFSTTYGLNIVAGPDLTGEVTMNLFEAPVREAFEQILASNGYGYQVEKNFLILVPLDELAAAGPAQLLPNRFEPQVIYLNHVRAEDMSPMLQPLLSPGEALVQGPGSTTGIDDISDVGGNNQASREMLVLLAGEETNAKIRRLLEQIDIPPPQVQVEATILAVTLNDKAALGVDFTAFGGIDFQALGSSTDVSDSITTGPAEGPQLQDWLLGVRQTGFTKPGSAGLHLGIMRNQVGAFVEAVEELGNVAILSNPKVLVLNRQPAQVLVGRKIGYQTVTATETSTVQNIQFLEVGTSLVFRPYVSEDGYVRMEIQPKSSDGVVSAQTGLPEESTTEVTTNVLVRSGNTIVIGGLMENQITTNRTQVPFLGSLPVIGSLFRREEEQERRLEVIVLLTPRIVTESDLVKRANEERKRLYASVSELTASHSGYLRPSMARKFYSAAASALADGNLTEALAKAEFGLLAMPADPDLAAIARHVRQELHASELDDAELRDAIELLDRMTSEEL